MMKREEGFSLIELLTVVAIMAILFTLGAFAVRHFWFVRSLEGGKQEMITQLRQIQQRVGAASAPLVYGARFTVGSGEWDLVEYDTSTGTTCKPISEGTFDKTIEFDAGVIVSDADFVTYEATPACLVGGATDIVWFFARGTATRGSVTIHQPLLNRSETVCVAALTGRVSEGPPC